MSVKFIKRFMICLAAVELLLVLSTVLGRYWPYKPYPGNICEVHMLYLAKLMLVYSDKTGRFPHSNTWIKELRSISSKSELCGLLKCPEDISKSLTSYTMNPRLSGRAVKSIPEAQAAEIIMLREKRFSGSHGFIAYADGHTSPLDTD